jgi:sulfite dehydrogenase
VEYRPNARVIAVDASAMTARTEFDTVKGDVLNIVPPQRAGDIAMQAGLITHNNRWCDVDWRTMESRAVKGITCWATRRCRRPACRSPAHGERARQGGRRGAGRADQRPRAEPQPGDDQHLLQLRIEQ